MPDETAVLSDALRALAKELWPRHEYNIDTMEFDDQLLLLGVRLERELAKKIDKLPARYPDGYEGQPTARPRNRD